MACVLQISGLTKSFGEVRAVDGVTLSVASGGIWIVGARWGQQDHNPFDGVRAAATGFRNRECGWGRTSGRTLPRRNGCLGWFREDALYEELSGRENLEFWGRLAGLDGRAARVRAGELLDSLDWQMGRRRGEEVLGRHETTDQPGCGPDAQAEVAIAGSTHGRHRSAGPSECAGVHSRAWRCGGPPFSTPRITSRRRSRSAIGSGSLTMGVCWRREPWWSFNADSAGIVFLCWKGPLPRADPSAWAGFSEHFRILQKTERQWVVAATTPRNPPDCLRELLALPVQVENVTLKKPSLNDVFLQLTGRGLRMSSRAFFGVCEGAADGGGRSRHEPVRG